MTIRVENHELAFSTAWMTGFSDLASEIITACKELNLSQFTLGPHLNCPPSDYLRDKFGSSKVKTVAIHNAYTRNSSKPDHLNGDFISSPIQDEAVTSFTLTLETIRALKILKTKRIIIQLGSVKDQRLVEIQEGIDQIPDDEVGNPDIENLIAEGLEIRKKYIESYLDRTIRVLFELLKVDPEVIICIETGHKISHISDSTSLNYIFEDLKNERLKYWHNAGYAHVQETLGLSDPGVWLGDFGRHLSGVSLNDASGKTPHLPPGTGKVDFQGILEALPADAIRLLDLKNATSIIEYQLGLDGLRHHGF